LSAGTRRSGSNKFGLFNRASPEGGHRSQHGERVPPAWEAPAPGPLAWGAPAAHAPHPPRPPRDATELYAGLPRTTEPYAALPRPSRGAAEPYAGRHASPRRKTARQRARKVVPAAAVAAAVAAGAAAYGVVGAHSQAAQLTDIAQPSSLSSPARPGVGGAGGAEAAASTMIRAANTAGRTVGRASAKPQPSKSATVTAAPTSSATHAAAAAAAATPTAATSTASSSSTPATTTLSCNLSYGLLPANVTAIVSFLLAHGYTDNAAAGIAGNMYQESKGNPESEGMGGGGLIGFTPLPDGYVTGDPAVDLETQLDAVLTYNQQWASYLPALDDAATPADAAYIYVTDFERAGIPAASTREAAADAVAEACGI